VRDREFWVAACVPLAGVGCGGGGKNSGSAGREALSLTRVREDPRPVGLQDRRSRVWRLSSVRMLPGEGRGGFRSRTDWDRRTSRASVLHALLEAAHWRRAHPLPG